MAEIPLTQGMVAIVDEEDFDYLNQWKWQALRIGYAARSVICQEKKRMIYMHQLLIDVPKGKETDHKDRNKLNNCRSNLRACFHRQNTRNRGKPRKITSSIFKGVYWNKGRRKWQAYFRLPQPSGNGKVTNLGRFKDEEQAALAYNEAATKYFGDFARLNTIQEGSYGR